MRIMVVDDEPIIRMDLIEILLENIACGSRSFGRRNGGESGPLHCA